MVSNMPQKNQLRLRPYRRNDAERIVTWCANQAAFYKWSAGILGEYPLTAERFNRAMAARDDNDRYFPFVAVDGTGVVGFFILRQPGTDPEELRFGFVIVDPAVRGRGYGKKMLRLGMEYAFHLYGAKKVTLGVFANNPGAYHCYKSVGFAENGSNEDYKIGDEIWKCIEMELRNTGAV